MIDLAFSFSYGQWPFEVGDLRTITKTRATQNMMGKTWRARREIAETELRDALNVLDPSKTSGKFILTYDDVFTDGFTLNEVARCLIDQGGAKGVCGVTLARQPWRGR